MRFRFQKRFNYKLFLGLIVGFALLGGGTYFFHKHQLERTSRNVYAEGVRLEEAGQPKLALEFYEFFSLLNPNDNDARIRYALLLNKLTTNSQERYRAYLKLNDAARRTSPNEQLCSALVPLCFELKRYSEAREHLLDLRRLGVKDPELLRQQALVEIGEEKYPAAETWYKRAIEARPTDPKLSSEFATLLRTQLHKPEQADQVIDRLIQVAGTTPDARLMAGQYFIRWGNLGKASEVLTPTGDPAWAVSAEILLARIQLAFDRDDRATAKTVVETSLTKFPADPRFALKAVQLAAWEGNRELAISRIRPLMGTPPKNTEAYWHLVNLMIDLGQTEQSEAMLKASDPKEAPWIAQYLQGRIAIQKRNWIDARTQFDRVVNSPYQPPVLVRQFALLMQAECSGLLGNPDQQAQLCREALQLNDAFLPARKMLAATLANLGQVDGALREYRRLPAEDVDVCTQLVRLSIRQNLRVPVEQQNWKQTQAYLTPLEKSNPVAFRLLQLELLTAQQKTTEARKLVDEIRTLAPQQVAPWLYLIEAARKAGDAPRILAAVADAEKQIGPRAEWSLARFQQLRITANPDLVKLEANELAKLSPDEQVRFLIAVRDLYSFSNDATSAERVCRHLLTLRPHDLDNHFRLFELSARKEDEATCRTCITAIAKLEGNSGALVPYAEAVLLTMKVRKGDRSQVAIARKWVNSARSTRPTWLPPKILDAELYELDGQTAKALEQYEALGEVGSVPLEVTQKYVQLLTRAGRYLDARTVLSKLPEQTLEKSGLKGTSAAVNLLAAQGDAPEAVAERRRALETARKTVGPDTKDSKRWLWLGEMALLAGEPKEAEQAFLKAREFNPTAPEPWFAIISLYARTDLKKATAELTAAQSKVVADRKPLFLAASYELVGNLKEAAREYQTALAANPDNPGVLRSVAGFHLRTGEWTKAEVALRKLLTLTKQSDALAWVRRSLALTLARLGGYERFQEGEALLRANASHSEPTPADRWCRAMILAYQHGYRREAIQLLESEVASNPSIPADMRYLLVQLYERDGRGQLAQAEMDTLLRNNERNPVYLAHCAQLMLKNGDVNTLPRLIDRLVAITGESGVTMELRARLATKNGQTTEAAKLVAEYATKQNLETQLRAAQLLEELKAFPQAEKFYRDFAQKTPDPRATLLVAGFLARQNRLSESLAICDAAWKTCPQDAVAQTCLACVRAARPTPEEIQRVERALAAAKDSIAVRVYRAEWKQYREQFPEAIEVYRTILKDEPRHLIALNNLALLLALRGGTDEMREAVQLIDAALEKTGPHAEFLDTRGVVLTQANRAEDAILDLQRAIADAPTAMKHFHLAQALLKVNRTLGAYDAYQKAVKLGIKPDDVHALERKEFERIAKLLK